MNAIAAPLALPNYSSLGSIIFEDMDRYEAETALKAANWSFAGDGAETRVFISPQRDRVVKLLRGFYSGNEATINAAREHPDNPHLPRVYRTMPLDGDVAVETEVLDRAPEQEADKFRTTSHLRQFGDYARPRVRNTRSAINLMKPGSLKDAVKALERAALDFEDESGETYAWDIHGGNFMVRPSTGELVLNDTLYNYRGRARRRGWWS